MLTISLKFLNLTHFSNLSSKLILNLTDNSAGIKQWTTANVLQCITKTLLGRLSKHEIEKLGEIFS